MRVLLLERDRMIAAAVCRELSKSRVRVEQTADTDFGDAPDAGQQIDEEYDAVIVGGIPDQSAAVTALRGIRAACPILCLLDSRSTALTVELLNAGADDVLVKPVSGLEISARIKVGQRRAHGHVTSVVQIGRLTAFLDGRDPEVDGERLRLSHREHAIFTILALNHRRVVSKERIYEAVYGLTGTDPLDKVIDVYICKLRKKISQATGEGQYIETVYGRGYKLERPAAAADLIELGTAPPAAVAGVRTALVGGT